MSGLTSKEKKIAQWIFGLVGVFNHYEFFTDKLWRNVPGFKDKDEAEVKCAFMHYQFHNTFHYNTLPVNSSWFAEFDDVIKYLINVLKHYEGIELDATEVPSEYHTSIKHIIEVLERLSKMHKKNGLQRINRVNK